MNTLTPLESLFDVEHGSALPLPSDLAALYGRLAFPPHPGGAHVVGNFVTTLDGVVTLNEPGHASGGDISGFNRHDQMVMGLLRTIADAVIVGAGTLRSVPQHRWTAQYIYPSLADVYQQLRTSLGKKASPLNVIVTAHGEVSLDLPVFQSGEVPVLLVTTTQGAERIRAQRLPPSVQLSAVHSAGSLSARTILEAVSRVRQCDVILVEGGPQLLGDFLAEQCLDELFLTLAPQIAGRDGQVERPGLVSGKRFAPEHPLWGTLVSVKCGGSHLFLRYAFEMKETTT
ncbi:MAG: dihydrofolate reductase family protein [Ktedonobacteraceae bacterium]|jgi:riboflavin biosynthesis pyrimidine reductase